MGLGSGDGGRIESARQIRRLKMHLWVGLQVLIPAMTGPAGLEPESVALTDIPDMGSSKTSVGALGFNDGDAAGFKNPPNNPPDSEDDQPQAKEQVSGHGRVSPFGNSEVHCAALR